MAIYIEITKVSETTQFVDYAFNEISREPGRIRISRETGTMELIENQANYSEFVWRRAMRRLNLHWERGEFPEKTCWAS